MDRLKADHLTGAFGAEGGLERGECSTALDLGSESIERLPGGDGGERVRADDVQDGETEIRSVNGVEAGRSGVSFIDIAPESGLIAERIDVEIVGCGASFLFREDPAEAEGG